MERHRIQIFDVDDLRRQIQWQVANNPYFQRKPIRLHVPAREQALTGSAQELGVDTSVAAAEVWLAVVELGYPDTIVTLTAAADGTTRVYFGGRGAVIAAHERTDVRDASRRLLSLAAGNLPACKPVEATPPPEPGRVTFYLRTPDGTFGAEASGSELVAGHHPLSGLHRAAVSVLTTIRDPA